MTGFSVAELRAASTPCPWRAAAGGGDRAPGRAAGRQRGAAGPGGRVVRPERGIGPAAAAGRESRVRNCPCRWWLPLLVVAAGSGDRSTRACCWPPARRGRARGRVARPERGIGPAAAAGRESCVRNCPCRWWSPPAAPIVHQAVLLTAGVSRAAMAIDPRAANKKAR